MTYQYDPFGRRIYSGNPSGTTIYVYDGDNISEELSATGVLQERYTYGPGTDEPLVGQRQPKIFYYEADGLGSVTSLTDPTGAVAATYTYNSFGFLTNSTGSATNWFRYTGRQFDSNTALYYYRARYYDPVTGRFLSEDPLRFSAGVNLYAYVENSPTNRTDPLGTCPQGQDRNPCSGISQAQQQFVSNNYQNAQFLAGVLNTTPANILGVSALESNWGTSDLALQQNNYFGLTYPFPGTGPAYGNFSTYPTWTNGFLESGLSLALSRHQGPKLNGVTDPAEFGAALTTAPYAFNSEPGRYQRYLNLIHAVQNVIGCLHF